MNDPTTFQPAPDGWFHIAPLGTFPHPTGALQVIDAEACEAMLGTFQEEARQPNFPGLLVDFDHSSHDPAQPTTAAGWIGGLDHRGDGLYAQIRWSDLGHQALTGGRYRLASPVWNRADCDEWAAPFGDDRDALHLRPRRRREPNPIRWRMKFNFKTMNDPTSFQPAPDGWFHIAPHGTFPHPNGALQVIDAEACDAMLGTFNEEARQPNFPGLLVDFDHSSHDPAQPTTAAGWIGGLEHRDDGLYAQIRWSDLGHQALTGGRYRLASPVWNRADCDQWTAPAPNGRDTVHLRPRRLDRLALTNDPNLPGLMPLSNRR